MLVLLVTDPFTNILTKESSLLNTKKQIPSSHHRVGFYQITMYLHLNYFEKTFFCVLAITVSALNPKDVTGWFNKTEVLKKSLKLKGEKFVKCIETHALSSKIMNFSLSPEHSAKIKYSYINPVHALVKNLEVKPDVIRHEKPRETLQIKMDNRFQYFVYITDPKMQFFTDSSPDFIPRIFLNMKPKADSMFVYMKVVLNIP